MFAAMNYLQFDGTCGRCIRVQGTDSGASGQWYTVKIIDNCPTCNRGDVDFSSEVGGWAGRAGRVSRVGFNQVGGWGR
jgi:hypothetical protein